MGASLSPESNINPDNYKENSKSSSQNDQLCLHDDDVERSGAIRGRKFSGAKSGRAGHLPGNFPLSQFFQISTCSPLNQQTELHDCTFTYNPKRYNERSAQYEDPTQSGLILYALFGLILLCILVFTLIYLFYLQDTEGSSAGVKKTFLQGRTLKKKEQQTPENSDKSGKLSKSGKSSKSSKRSPTLKNKNRTKKPGNNTPVQCKKLKVS